MAVLDRATQLELVLPSEFAPLWNALERVRAEGVDVQVVGDARWSPTHLELLWDVEGRAACTLYVNVDDSGYHLHAILWRDRQAVDRMDRHLTGGDVWNFAPVVGDFQRWATREA